MEQVKELFSALGHYIEKLARASVVVAKPVSVGDRHVITLCELSLAFGGAGGSGATGTSSQRGVGGGAGGGAKAVPIAVLVIDGGRARLEKIGG